MMTVDISASLINIEGALQRLGRQTLLRLLQEGASVEAVRSSLEAVGLISTPELEFFYSWKNGTTISGGVTLDDIHFFPGFYMLSLDDAIENYSAFVVDSRWKPGWLPIFANGGGDFYVFDLSLISVRPVRHFRIDESNHPIEFTSLEAMLSTLAAAFERSIFYVDTSGYLEMDDLAFGALAAELNHDVDWWRS
jgi:hypothetical protein